MQWVQVWNRHPHRKSDRNILAPQIQVFRQRLSHKSVKAYATMPIGIMGSRVWLCLIEFQGDSATRKEKAWIHVFKLFPSTTLKHVEVQSRNTKTTVTHNVFRHCRASFSSFVRQPYSKLLYKVKQALFGRVLILLAFRALRDEILQWKNTILKVVVWQNNGLHALNPVWTMEVEGRLSH